MLDALWLLGLTALWVGAWFDWRARQVPNRVWSLTLWAAAPFLVWELLRNPVDALWRLSAAAPVVPVAWFLWLGGQFGAGDSKAIMLAGFLMSPVGYLDPASAQFIPVLDALFAGLLITEIWRRLGRHQGTPFLAVLAPLATLTAVVGGLLWWPIVLVQRIWS